MSGPVHFLDAHQAPPPALKEQYKKYQKLKIDDLGSDPNIIDFEKVQLPDGVRLWDSIKSVHLGSIFSCFAEGDQGDWPNLHDAPIYFHQKLPGLLMLPALLPLDVQKSMISRLLHRDLSDPRHKTNLHLHYEVPYNTGLGETPYFSETTNVALNNRPSFFSSSPLSKVMFMPKNPLIHRPLSISRVLQKSLRWITLGGQYDWTNKVYPNEVPPKFPTDIAELLSGLFPDMKPQAAIVNLYSPGDTLSLHRDVSENSDKGLVSISFGCDCLFVIGNELSDGLVIRLRSGDGLYMTNDARFAWHGVPRILPNTCPSFLDSWPAESGAFEDWKGWMSNKRINLNVRQMND